MDHPDLRQPPTREDTPGHPQDRRGPHHAGTPHTASLSGVSHHHRRLWPAPSGRHLQVPDIDRARLLVHVRAGKGAKDRSGPPPTPTLEGRRQDWETPRHPVWIVPAPGRGGTGLPTATASRPRSRVPDAVRAALTERGVTKRAAVHTLRHRDATPLLEAGVNRRLIQESLGHTTPTTTALSTPLPRNADAMARDALHRLLSDL